jgi:signal transduction histidine kinase
MVRDARAPIDRMEATMQRMEMQIHDEKDSRLYSAAQYSDTPPTNVNAGIVHDLGNFIQIASSAVSIVERRIASRADLEPIISGAKTSLEKAGALVRKTIGTAHDDITATEPADLLVCLTEIEALVHNTWTPDIWLDLRVSPGLPPLTCDFLALQSAILNLLLNARDAMPTGGVISIYADAVWLASDIAGIEIRVTDSGVGMRSEMITRAFEPFFTTKFGGLGGVGLPMIERFVREAGGHVLIQSEFGVGTTVTLQLPASGQSANSVRDGAVAEDLT